MKLYELTKSGVEPGDTLTDNGGVERRVAPESGIGYLRTFPDDALLTQYGSCDDCETNVISWAKKAVCPNCKSRVNCT